MTDWKTEYGKALIREHMLEERLERMSARWTFACCVLKQIADMTCDNPAAPGVASDALDEMGV